MTDEVTPNEIDTEKEVEPMKVEIIEKEKEEKDNTSWEEEDPWDFTKMTEQDIKEAEEARNA